MIDVHKAYRNTFPVISSNVQETRAPQWPGHLWSWSRLWQRSTWPCSMLLERTASPAPKKTSRQGSSGIIRAPSGPFSGTPWYFNSEDVWSVKCNCSSSTLPCKFLVRLNSLLLAVVYVPICSNIVKWVSIFPSRIDQVFFACLWNERHLLHLITFSVFFLVEFFNEWINVGSYSLTWVVYRSSFTSLDRARLGRAVACNFSSSGSVCRHTMTCPTTCSSSFSAKTWPTPLETGSLVLDQAANFHGSPSVGKQGCSECCSAWCMTVSVDVCGVQSISNICYSD